MDIIENNLKNKNDSLYGMVLWYSTINNTIIPIDRKVIKEK